MEKEIQLCKTKAGKGLKIVVNDVWYYTSWVEFGKMMNDKAIACTFRSIDKEAEQIEKTIITEVPAITL